MTQAPTIEVMSADRAEHWQLLDIHEVAEAAAEADYPQRDWEERAHHTGFMRTRSGIVRPHPDRDTFGAEFSRSRGLEYRNPQLAIATNSIGYAVGYAHGATSIAGTSPFTRTLKSAFRPAANGFWVGNVVTRPGVHDAESVIANLGIRLLRAADVRQSVSTSVWPEETETRPDHFASLLPDLGFEPSEERLIWPFGLDREPVNDVLMVADSVGSVIQRLKDLVSQRA